MKLMILDGNSIVNRAFFGVRMLNAPDGTPTNAVYGFLTILQRLLEDQKPDAVCVSFDLKAPTFRHKAYDGYKAQRKGMPEELAVQIPILKQVLDAMGIRRYELEGYEADDILGTVAAVCEKNNWECRIVTGDKDSLQLISDTTGVVHVKSRMGQTETILYTPEVFREEYGFPPRGIVDLKALMGDSSDNIPGVPGVGEKTAMDLMRRYGSLEAIYRDLDGLEVKEGVRKKLREGEESAKLSYWLATILRDVPLEFRPEDALWDHNYQPELFDLMKRLGFHKFIEKWGLQETIPLVQNPGDRMPRVSVPAECSLEALADRLDGDSRFSVYPAEGLDHIELCDGQTVYDLQWNECGDDYRGFLRKLFSVKEKLIAHDVKDLMLLLLKDGLPLDAFCFDTALAGYLLDATASDYSLSRLTMG